MSQPTAGDWERDTIQESDYMITFSGNGRVIGAIFTENVTASEEELANLRLILAAPALVKACQSALESARMALAGEWDRSDDGFQAQVDSLEQLLYQALGVIPERV